MRRGGIIALVVFQSLWLTVILPGHTRGAITLPGYKADADKCCKHETPKQEAPSKDRASHCAVCFFAARLSMPVAIDMAPQELARCGQHEAPVPEIVASLELQLTYLGRAPPTV